MSTTASLEAQYELPWDMTATLGYQGSAGAQTDSHRESELHLRAQSSLRAGFLSATGCEFELSCDERARVEAL